MDNREVSSSVPASMRSSVVDRLSQERTVCALERDGAFSRTVPLPVVVQGEKATSQLKDGILEIRIPKGAEARVKEIPVSV